MAHKRPERPPYDRTMIYGLLGVAEYMRYSIGTVRRWKRQHAFPLFKMPNGTWATSTELIDCWLQARDEPLSTPGRMAQAHGESTDDTRRAD